MRGMMLSRRIFLKGAGAFTLATAGLGSYAFGIEPGLLLDVTRYRVTPKGWPPGLTLRIAVIADIHACEPWMPVSRIREVAGVANAMAPDLIVLLGDFNAGHLAVTGAVYPDQWGEALEGLKAPLGVHAILGNHDWWHGALPNMRSDDGESVRRALTALGSTVLENDAIRLVKDGQPFWLLGLGDQMAHRSHYGFRGVDNLSGTLAQIKDNAPAILLAHEPFVFDRVPRRVAVTLCGHTHGGQVNLPFLGPTFAARRYGPNRVYGHMIEDDRHLVISAGLGTSILPVRFLRPPEVVEVTISAPATPVATAPATPVVSL
jgi:predicted MPP superfamily phosphohydrolase